MGERLDTLFEGVTSGDIEDALGRGEANALAHAGERSGGAEDAAADPASEWRDRLSTLGYDFVVRWETGGRAYYDQVIKGRPIWPGYSSGITIGFGYDLGYHTQKGFKDDWDPHLPKSAVQRLSVAIGLKTVEPNRAAKVERARELVSLMSDIVVSWEVGERQFQSGKLPDLVRQLERALPNLSALHTHCYGALLSLVFNRGPAFKEPGQRYREMREIGGLMAIGTFEAFCRIPGQFRLMKRIWGESSSLAKRREGEAKLFEAGLKEMNLANDVRALIVSGELAFDDCAAADAFGQEGTREVLAEAASVESGVEHPDEDLELDLGDTREDDAAGSDVRWNPDDDEQPDYRHLDRTLAGREFRLRVSDIDRLIGKNAFAVRAGDLIFALRGARLVGDSSQHRRTEITMVDQRPDHRAYRCVIGVRHPDATLSAFQGSTVPNAYWVKKCRDDFRDGKLFERLEGNVLPTGCYLYTVGTHKPDKPGEIRGALRLGPSEFGASRVVVLRSVDDLLYDRHDRWQSTIPADNIHPGRRSNGFSSAGCLTLPGDYVAGRHTGLWGAFRLALGLSEDYASDRNKQFSCVLLTGLDAAVAAAFRVDGSDESTEDEALLRLRHGSSGARVRALQMRLGVDADGDFGPGTRSALIGLQRQRLGWADGLLSPEVARALELDILEGGVMADPAADGDGRSGAV